MPVSYNVGTNLITVVGYALGAECTFQDLYNADKAGTLSLHARAGIVGVDGAGVAVDRAERPTDYVVLGGASNDLYIIIANWNLMTNATIRVTGTDRDGAAQVDDVVVNANGNFSTALWFRTITHTHVTVFNTPGGGSFDYDLTQDQWGVVWKTGDIQFRLDCRLTIGDGTATWFADEEKQVLFQDPKTSARAVVYVSNNAVFRLGRIEDVPDKTTSRGCALRLISTYNGPIIYLQAGGIILSYSSLHACEDRPGIQHSIGNIQAGSQLWNTRLARTSILVVSGGDFYNVSVENALRGLDAVTGGTFENVLITDMTFEAVRSGAAPQTFSYVTVYECTYMMGIYIANGARFLINCTSDNWLCSFFANITGPIYRQYTFDLRVVDNTGTGIAGVTAAMVDVFGTPLFSVVTDGVGDIAQQVVTYRTYDRLAATGGTQDTTVTFSPHTLTISRAGYAPRTVVYTMDRAREEIEKLGGAAPHGMEYRRRRVPGEVSALYEYE